jgi:hypothetical protein
MCAGVWRGESNYLSLADLSNERTATYRETFTKADSQDCPTKLPKKEVLKGLNSNRTKWSFLAQENGMFQASLICH